MQEFPCKRWAGAPALVCLLLLATGCGGGQRSAKDYLPPEQKARAALENALTAWQNGQPVGKIPGADGTVQAVDSEWKAGQKLARYEIVKAEPGDGPPRFSVKLQIQGAPAAREVRYVVIGIDPLWVYREEDYQRAMGM